MAATPEPTLKDPWLIAAWPGMGSVAVAAASYLIAKLEATPIQTLVDREHFDISSVVVEGGVVRRPVAPKSTLYAARAPRGVGPDLLIFVGEAQPSNRGYEFCHSIIDLALVRGVRRVVTFAAMATPTHPKAPPRVFAVASETGILPLLAEHDVAVLSEGQISGSNGVLLAAAAERGIEGFCLLGELPFFAVGIPNPKASLAVLRAFARIARTPIDLDELEEQARLVERALIEMLERAAKREPEEEGPSFGAPAVEGEAAPAEPEGPSAETVARIEDLFRRARADKSRALKLKAELDRLGLFKRYEDRFLDLFKKDEPS